MRRGSHFLFAAALLLTACGPDLGSVETSKVEMAVQPRAAVDATSHGAGASGSAPTVASAGALDEGSLTIGLLAPSLPALALGTYASACEPFEDSLGSCL